MTADPAFVWSAHSILSGWFDDLMNLAEQVDSLQIEAQMLRWQLACTALTLLQRDPCVLRGLLVGCSHGPVHQCYLTRISEHFRITHIPVSVSTESLQGGLDVNQTLASGRRVYQRGLLQTQGGALLINGAERLQTTTSAILSAFLDQPAAQAPVLVAMDESTEDESGLADTGLGERLGMMVTLPHLPFAILESLVEQQEADEGPVSLNMEQHDYGSEISRVELPDDILLELNQLAIQLGVASMRALLHATRVARGHALLQGRYTVLAEDAAIAVQLVLAPRATQQPGQTDAEESDEPENSPEDNDNCPDDEQPDDLQANQEVPEQDATKPDEDKTDENGDLAEQLLDAVQATLPQHLIAQLARGQKNQSGTGRDAKAAAVGSSGRPIGVRRPRGGLHGQRLNLVETLKCAVPKQRLRKQESNGRSRLQIRTEDFRVTRFRQPTRTTTLFVVDASGSAALHRLAEAKGAVELLLAECYVRRDRVAMISFRGQDARLELPPTRSLVRAKRELAGLPGGGGTPLALGLDLAIALVRQLKQAGEKPVVIIMSDGKANVARDGQASRKLAMEESHQAARLLAAAEVNCLFIDTSPRPRPQAAELARSLNARYLPLPPGGARQLPSLVSAT